MEGYFPYSYVVGVSCKIRQKADKMVYFSEWIVCGESKKQSRPKSHDKNEISELYY